MNFPARKLLFTLLVLLVLLAAVVAGVKIRQKRAVQLAGMPPPEAAPWALHVATVERGSLYRAFPTLAELTASQEITLRAQVAGTILEMGPREGVAVKPGQRLARIDVRELLEKRAGLEAQLAAARAEVERTRDEYHRQQELKKKRLTSDEALQARRTAWVAAKEKVNNLQRQISALQVRIGYGEVKAPVAAVIAARLAEPGDAVQPGTPLYRLSVDSAARMKVTLPQEILSRIHPGTEVVLRHGGRQQRVKLSRIFPALDARALGTAEADLERLPFGLPSGARIPAEVILQSVDDARKVPLESLVRTGSGRTWLFKVEEGRLRKVAVQVLLEGDRQAAVKGNLQAGTKVVVAHRSVLLQLSDGDPVVVEPAR
ncbi:MAG TPA: efflux RND transporter periplasmic adaptor subunit [Thiolapillus brandeum]|uniref:Efflux RND transporter periplasmic adaptor subunit n=1 Tax=Thiolapillus brandeum TaxID=1076588 RepID=A0A7C5IZD4_9GAMM|nr:efflux RND transporter periplasmic adaptor subunit [Thiolapillus brandeum]